MGITNLDIICTIFFSEFDLNFEKPNPQFKMNLLNQAGKSVWSQCVDPDCGGDRRTGLLQLALQLQRILVKRHFGFTLSNVFRYIYNLLDFNDLDNFYASAKADLASPPETHWDSWSSTLVELVITAGDNLTIIHSS